MAHFFRKRPVTVEAVRFDGSNFEEVGEFLGQTVRPCARLVIQTLEGDMTASRGDYVIRGVQGELYPCKPDIFEATYVPVDEAAG